MTAKEGTWRVYLSGPTREAVTLCAFAADLRDDGHQVTSRWLESYSRRATGDEASRAQRDLADLRSSEFLVALTGPRVGGRGGRHTELGVAIERGLPIVLVGTVEHVFHHMAAVTVVVDFDAARNYLAASRRPPA